MITVDSSGGGKKMVMLKIDKNRGDAQEAGNENKNKNKKKNKKKYNKSDLFFLCFTNIINRIMITIVVRPLLSSILVVGCFFSLGAV